MVLKKKVNSETQYHPDEIPKAFRYHTEGRKRFWGMKVDGNKLTKNMTDNLKKNRWNRVFCKNFADGDFDVLVVLPTILKDA